jgi:hypothetical protein
MFMIPVLFGNKVIQTVIYDGTTNRQGLFFRLKVAMAATAITTISSIEPTAPTSFLSAVLLHKSEAVGAKRPSQIRAALLSNPHGYAGYFI